MKEIEQSEVPGYFLTGGIFTRNMSDLVDFRKTPCACGDCLNGNHDQCSRVDFNGQLERHNLAKGSINKKRKPKDAAPGSQPLQKKHKPGGRPRKGPGRKRGT